MNYLFFMSLGKTLRASLIVLNTKGIDKTFLIFSFINETGRLLA